MEAEEKKVSPVEARTRRSKMVARSKRKVADDQMIVLSDEASVSEDEDKIQIDDPNGPTAAIERPDSLS